MRILAINFLMLVFLSSTAFAFDHDHKSWTNVLKEYQTKSGLLKYKKLKADTKKNEDSDDKKKKEHRFNSYIKSIQAVSFKEYESFSKKQKLAFLINAYNALTVKLIIDNYPVKSIKKIGGWFTKPWSVEFFSLLDGKIKSLDPIEHEWIRPKFKDYRIHAAVNCASISCPPLRNEAFVASRLDKQLDGQMTAWLKDKNRNQIIPKSNTWIISKIFDWYESDFKKWGGGVASVIKKHLKIPSAPKDSKEIKLKYLNYNWDLNEAK